MRGIAVLPERPRELERTRLCPAGSRRPTFAKLPMTGSEASDWSSESLTRHAVVYARAASMTPDRACSRPMPWPKKRPLRAAYEHRECHIRRRRLAEARRPQVAAPRVLAPQQPHSRHTAGPSPVGPHRATRRAHGGALYMRPMRGRSKVYGRLVGPALLAHRGEVACGCVARLERASAVTRTPRPMS